MEKIAVILPVYKNDKVPHVRLSLNSILNQTYKGDFTLIIGVDGPVGEELVSCLKDYETKDNVSVQWFPKNRGKTATRRKWRLKASPMRSASILASRPEKTASAILPVGVRARN